jgi:hypothetical protein
MTTSTVVPPAWLAAYPGTRFLPEWRLMMWGPRGLVSAPQVEAMLHWLEAVEPALGTFHRFVDLSYMVEMRLRADEIAAIAKRRRERYRGEPVITVFLAGTALAYGLARIYEHLMSGTPIHVDVAVRFSSAARLLGIPPDALRRNAIRTSL